MGRLTEYLEYINSKPKELKQKVELFTHLTITDEIKKTRRELKLYKDKTLTLK